MTIYTQVAKNRAKTAFFLLFFMALFLAVGWTLSYLFDSPIILAIAAVLVIIQGAVSIWSSDKVALASARAIPLDQDPQRFQRAYRLTENLAITAGLPVPRLYLIDDSAMNAFSTGRNKDHAAIALTAGLIDNLNDNELSGVIAHELSHIGDGDILLMGVVMVMAGMIALLSDIFLRSMFWGFAGRRRDSDGTSMIILVIGIVLSILAPFAAMLIQLAISRKREFMADEKAVLLTRYPEGLIGALRKIGDDEAPLEVANRGNAFMYISDPLHGHWLSNLFSTHPPISERIRLLEVGSGMPVDGS